jgi:hypothetical protein
VKLNLVARSRNALEQEAAREAVLEELADRLLGASAEEFPAGDYPWYSERALRRRGDLIPFPVVREAEILTPTQSQLQEALRLLTRSFLPARKRLAFRLLARGEQPEAVAARLRISRSMLRRWTGEVCRELQLALAGDREGLLQPGQAVREAFREDTKRHAPLPERHCRPGQEACRGTGLCAFRWYLHYLSD